MKLLNWIYSTIAPIGIGILGARACSSFLKNELFAPLAARTEFMANLVMIYPIAYK